MFPAALSAQRSIRHAELPSHPECRINLTENLRLGATFRTILSFAIAPDGSIYVLDSDSSGISLFSPNGTFVRTIGETAEFKKPYRIAATSTRLFVYDRDPARILVFSPTGVLISS